MQKRVPRWVHSRWSWPVPTRKSRRVENTLREGIQEQAGRSTRCRDVLNVGRDVATRLQNKSKHRKSTGNGISVPEDEHPVTECQQKYSLLSERTSSIKSVEERNGCNATPVKRTGLGATYEILQAAGGATGQLYG